MDRTREQLETENAALRELLAAIAGARPPLPADSRDMERYYAAKHQRAGSVFAAAWAVAEEGTAAFIRGVTAGLCRDNAGPLGYAPESSEAV